MKNAKHNPSVIERFMLPNPMWQEGYKSFNNLFGRPLGWLFLVSEDGLKQLIRLDRKGCCSYYAGSLANERSCEAFLYKYGEQVIENDDLTEKLPSFYRCVFGKNGAVFSLKHLGKIRGLLILDSFTLPERQLSDLLTPFDHFLSSHIELAYKTFELNNFYETVHPRALALSTMHSVHRVISSSLRLNELLPRIGRLSAQVLKAKGCSIMLCDADNKYLLPFFSFGESKRFIHRQKLRIGRGLEGHMAKTGEFHLSRNSIGVPFIEDDVVGLIILWHRIDQQPFSKTDLEILRSLSEQAVVAIKNAQLYEETEQLTLGSIKTINDLLDLNFGSDRGHVEIMKDIIIEVGKDLGISSKELVHLERAMMLLDTGALAFPDKILRKKGKLTKKEFEQIKRIPLRGANLLRSISSLKPVIPIILHHRERYDGKGYPQGLKGEEIPIGARIIAVVDVFLAMISKRTYRESMTVTEALDEIQANRSTQFDPSVVDAFLRVVHRRDMNEKLLRLYRERSKSLSHI